MAFGQTVADSLVQKDVNLVRTVELDVDEEDHRDQDAKDDNRVNVTGEESGLKTSRSRVEDDTPRDKEGSQTVIHASERFDGSSSTKQKHGGDNNVGTKAKEEKGQVGGFPPTSVDNLGDRVRRRGNFL